MNTGLLAGCTPWPPEFAERYRALGYWTGQTLGESLRQRAQQSPERLCLICGERRWTYADLDFKVDRLAAALMARGLKPRERVVVQLPNIAEFFVVCFALFRLGALPVFALATHRRSEIVHFCRMSQACAYIISDQDNGFDYRTLAREVCAESPGLRQVIVVGEAQEFTSLDALCGEQSGVTEVSAEPLSLASPQAHEVAFLQLSGGSTGLPKLIPRTHDDYLYSVRASAGICGLSASSVYLCVLPVGHNFTLSSPGSLGIFWAGGCVVMAGRPTPEVAFPLIARELVTITALVPPLASIWLDAADGRRQDLSSLQLLQVGGARLSAEVACRITPVLGCRLQQVFGMAEGLVSYTRLDDPEDIVQATQGRPISPDDEIRIVDDADCEVAPGQVGHLLTRGPYTIRGYYQAAQHNQYAFTPDGFYRTGDLVRMQEGGYLIVEGRSKDQINRGGEKIAAAEIEEHLLAHPQVRDAALVAMPDPYLGERACAFVILRESTGSHHQLPAASDLRRFLRERSIAGYKIPDRIEMVDCLPKTGVGKIDKRALRQRIAQILAGAV
ncbi:(2,3-dihydroxybenzoyl)adenylate synthase [Herbaspirillum lusitanum]|uniref:(2,3-dihydroxybenzoyl)adenylate synthase n=1 Tax=Herbaspirillum lusitanum TaxID=213312 RepID=A0ABW9AFA3_9BURK